MCCVIWKQHSDLAHCIFLTLMLEISQSFFLQNDQKRPVYNLKMFFLNKIKLFEINFKHNIAIFIDFYRVCDPITPEVKIGDQLRKDYLNRTLISYNLDHYCFCVKSKLTNIWTQILLKFFFWSKWVKWGCAVYIFDPQF